MAVEEKGGRLDIQAILNNGIIANIEMQIRNRQDMQIRTTMYASKIMSREKKKGTQYRDIKKIILVNILGYNMFNEYDDYIHKTAIVLDKHREKIVIDNMEWWFIELPKFRKKHKSLNSRIDQWLLFIDDNDKEMIKMVESKSKILKEAREEMEYLVGEAAKRRLAELREIWDMDYTSDINYATEKGERRGKRKEKKEIAKKLLEMEMTIEQISKVTGLRKETIKKMK